MNNKNDQEDDPEEDPEYKNKFKNYPEDKLYITENIEENDIDDDDYECEYKFSKFGVSCPIKLYKNNKFRITVKN